ncbi:hypothetical protein [Muricoccus aerilatus]|nr:hypothetical protein [Roseomonas aerilata]
MAGRERDGRVSALLIALANVLDGMSREAAAQKFFRLNLRKIDPSH